MVREQLQPPSQLTPDQLELYPAGPVLSEINLLRYPFCLLSNNNLQELLKEAAQTNKTHISYEIEDQNGQKQIWLVKPNVVSGYTRPFDKKVLITVLKLVTEEQFPPPLIWKLGSLKRICRTMRIPDVGKHPHRVKESLIRISESSIYAECFFLKKKQDYWKEKSSSRGGNFTLWSVFWRGDELPSGEIADTIYLQFNAPFILSLNDFYVKPLDYDYWLKLSPLAQRLYELTGLKFYGLQDSSYVTFGYPELCQAMPIRPQEHLSDAKKILDRAHQQLRKTHWLQRAEWQGAKSQRRLDPKAPWVIRYYPGPRAQEELAQAQERLSRYQKLVQREKLPLWHDVQGWAQILTEELQDRAGKNRGFYIQLGKLIVQGKINQDLIWRSISIAKDRHLRGEVKKSLSACFTDEYKRQLKQRGQDLKALLSQV